MILKMIFVVALLSACGQPSNPKTIASDPIKSLENTIIVNDSSTKVELLTYSETVPADQKLASPKEPSDIALNTDGNVVNRKQSNHEKTVMLESKPKIASKTNNDGSVDVSPTPKRNSEPIPTEKTTVVKADVIVSSQIPESPTTSTHSTSMDGKLEQQEVIKASTKNNTSIEASEKVTPIVELVNKQPDQGRMPQTRPMHKYFDYLLSTYVSTDGKVNYKGISSEIDRLDKYLKDLQNFPPQDDWGRSEKLAYWINAYNAFTIKLICDNYPISSITDLDNGKPWDRKWIDIDGQSLSLNDIENVIIRPKFNEPRIHFAVNCAAVSCPPIANEAFTKDNLESLLTARTKAFINNPTYNILSDHPAQISKIFDWYSEDFGKVVEYVNKYMTSKQPPITEVEYLEYDWKLNK